MKNLIMLIAVLMTASIFSQDCIIPNGSFENWTGNDVPHYWFSSNVAGNEGKANELADFEFRNIFRAPGKFGSGIEIRNISIEDFMKEKFPKEWAQMSIQYKEMIRTKGSFSGFFGNCRTKDCNKLVAAGLSNFKPLTMPVTEENAPAYLKGYYKADLKGGDKVWINVMLLDGGYRPVGGVKPFRTENVLSKNTMDWREFTIPLDYFPDRLKYIKYAVIQVHLVGKDFPSSFPQGIDAVSLVMKYPSQEYSKLYLDELCFGGQGKEVDPDDPLLNGNHSGGDTATGGDTEYDSSNTDEVIYIATNGSDNNSGTSNSPFATLQKALTMANGKRQEGRGVKIIVKNGTYRQEAYISMSGASLPPLFIEAENTHQAIFMGTEPIASNVQWTNAGGNLYTTQTPKLHPNQKPVLDAGSYSNPMEIIVPALLVDGRAYTPTQNIQQVENSYITAPGMVMVNATNTNLTTAEVEVSVRENAIKIGNGGIVKVKGLRFKGFPLKMQSAFSQYTLNTGGNESTPGLSGALAFNCKFE